MSDPGAERLQRLLRSELGGLPVPAPPAGEVTRRGRALRARRRTLAWGVTAAVAAAALPVWLLAGRGGTPAGPVVTVNRAASPAVGGMFASGTVGGRPWRLAVGNIAGRPWCLPAVTLNGRDADVLYRAGSTLGKPAFLVPAPGFPGAGFGFTQVAPAVTRVAVQAGARRLTVLPVSVSFCGHRYRLAGFAFGHPYRGVSRLTAYSRLGMAESLQVPSPEFAGTPAPGTSAPGVWRNPGISAAGYQPNAPIAAGRTGGTRWHILQSLGPGGQCYSGTVASGSAWECLPIQAVPPGAALTWVPFPAGLGVTLTGYAGPASPRTAYAVATLSGGSTRRLTPDTWNGRKYLALAFPDRLRLTELYLFDRKGNCFATVTSIPSPK